MWNAHDLQDMALFNFKLHAQQIYKTYFTNGSRLKHVPLPLYMSEFKMTRIAEILCNFP